jgi:protein N-terminal amidase
VGYPEIYRNPEASSANGTEGNDNRNGLAASPAKMYNSLLVVDEVGQVIHNYRKRFLYYTDESWASEGEAEWSFKSLDFSTGMSDATTAVTAETVNKSIQIPTTFGICMDINPYKFEAPFNAYEFAHRVLDSQSHLVILSAAWLTNDANSIALKPAGSPDMNTFNYWLQRFWPLIEKRINYGDRQLDGFDTPTETKVILVFANRTGMEDGGPECIIPLAVYAGTSTIVTIMHKKDSPELDVKIHCWGIKGAREEGICFADIESEPEMTFVVKKISDDSD